MPMLVDSIGLESRPRGGLVGGRVQGGLGTDFLVRATRLLLTLDLDLKRECLAR